MKDFLIAFGLLFVIEGLIYALVPNLAKTMMSHVQETPEHTLRILGVAALATGVFVVWLVKG
ncbi:MAG: DUF2065 domain-containing protein [Hyphomicrobiaceae bacterium]|nr:DUF2065 domain-containing protein [Hyphomicrobiaceae bacterium]